MSYEFEESTESIPDCFASSAVLHTVVSPDKYCLRDNSNLASASGDKKKPTDHRRYGFAGIAKLRRTKQPKQSSLPSAQ